MHQQHFIKGIGICLKVTNRAIGWSVPLTFSFNIEPKIVISVYLNRIKQNSLSHVDKYYYYGKDGVKTLRT